MARHCLAPPWLTRPGLGRPPPASTQAGSTGAGQASVRDPQQQAEGLQSVPCVEEPGKSGPAGQQLVTEAGQGGRGCRAQSNRQPAFISYLYTPSHHIPETPPSSTTSASTHRLIPTPGFSGAETRHHWSSTTAPMAP
ncbi:unnamed protein product [Boreogadus saida]